MLDDINREFLDDVLTAIGTLDSLSGSPPDPYLLNEISMVRDILSALGRGEMCDQGEALEVVAFIDTIIVRYPALEGEIAYSRRADRIKMNVTAHLGGN